MGSRPGIPAQNYPLRKERTNTFQHLVTRGVLLLYHKKSHPRSLEWLFKKNLGVSGHLYYTTLTQNSKP